MRNIFLSLLFLIFCIICFFSLNISNQKNSKNKSAKFTYLGKTIKNNTTFTGFFSKHKNHSVYYGVTRNGMYGRLFRYNLNTEKVDLVVPIKGSLGSAWGLTSIGNNIYIGTFFNPHLFKYNTIRNKLTKTASFPPYFSKLPQVSALSWLLPQASYIW